MNGKQAYKNKIKQRIRNCLIRCFSNRGKLMELKFQIENLVKEVVENVLCSIFTNLKNYDFSQIISKTQEQTNKLGVNLVKLACKEIERGFDEQRDKHRVVVKNKGKTRSILSELGEIKLQRTLYFDKNLSKCFFAVDELLHLEKYSRIDKNLQSKLVNAATLTSFGKASELIDRKVTRQTVHNLVKKVNVKELEVPPSQKTKQIEDLYIEADEDHIHLNNSKSAEVKLIYVHEGTRKVCSGRTELINPKYFVTTSDDVDKFWSDVAYYIQTNYATRNTTIHLSGDGAAWIKYGIGVFPGCRYHLDKFHIHKSITNACYGNKKWQAKIISALKEKDFSKAAFLYKEHYKTHEKKSERKNIVNSWLYLQNNLKSIDLSKQYSCAAEGHVSHVLSARMSSRPMGWSLHGAERIAKLRAYHFNGGDFSKIFDKSADFSMDECFSTNYNYMQTRSSSYYKPAKVVGIDGLSDRIAKILRSTTALKSHF